MMAPSLVTGGTAGARFITSTASSIAVKRRVNASMDTASAALLSTTFFKASVSPTFLDTQSCVATERHSSVRTQLQRSGLTAKCHADRAAGPARDPRDWHPSLEEFRRGPPLTILGGQCKCKPGQPFRHRPRGGNIYIYQSGRQEYNEKQRGTSEGTTHNLERSPPNPPPPRGRLVGDAPPVNYLMLPCLHALPRRTFLMASIPEAIETKFWVGMGDLQGHLEHGPSGLTVKGRVKTYPAVSGRGGLQVFDAGIVEAEFPEDDVHPCHQ